MATITLNNVEKRFGDIPAVKAINLTVNDGEFVVLLGPSGCGKTTTLRMISGLESTSGGTILINGRDVTWEPPYKRDIAFVFQFFALYPHLSVWENIAFPLISQKESRITIAKKVAEVAAALNIESLLHIRPMALSGGDKQRVALARALVRRPTVFLMDEPLGALDAHAREYMRSEIKRLHFTQNATTVYVTHDQVEAMAMGDRIVVMSDAEVQQVGTPADVYHNPANLFVAHFIGSPGMNLLRGHCSNGAIHLPGANAFNVSSLRRFHIEKSHGLKDEIILGFRPEAGRILNEPSSQNACALNAEVYAADLYGAHAILHLRMGNEIIQIRADRNIRYPIGSALRFTIDSSMIRLFDPDTQSALKPENIHG